MAALPDYVLRAIVCGPTPKPRNFRQITDPNKLTRAEKVILFAERHLRIPDGEHVGQPIRLDVFQETWLRAVLDNPKGTRTAILSIARRNGKSFLLAVLILAVLCGPLAEPNITCASAANSRDQASLVFKMMHQMILQSPDVANVLHVTPSTKEIKGLALNTTYYAMSAEAKTGHGRSLKYIVLDESGQIKGPSTEYTEMLRTSQGSYSDALFATISTQAASDADFLSILIDDAVRSQDPHTVCHLYTSPKELDLLDAEGMRMANPGLGVFRSKSDLANQLEQAKRLPAMAAGAENLLLNRRVAQEHLFLSPQVWRKNSSPPDLEVFRNNPVSIGLDLSARNDLTAAVIAAMDPVTRNVHLLPFVFCPTHGVEERSRRDRAPYSAWITQGQLIPVGGESMDYAQIIDSLKTRLDDLGIALSTVEFDRWRIEDFKRVAEEEGFGSLAVWNSIGQGFKEFSPRAEAFLSLMLEGRICHGNHPLLNMAAANAVAVINDVGDVKLSKAKATQRIDPLIAAIMATYAVSDGRAETLGNDLSWWIA
jgi:phage terminase large subunit-like protein